MDAKRVYSLLEQHRYSILASLFMTLEMFSPAFYLKLRKYTLIKLLLVFIFVFQSGNSVASSAMWTVIMYAIVMLLDYILIRMNTEISDTNVQKLQTIKPDIYVDSEDEIMY